MHFYPLDCTRRTILAMFEVSWCVGLTVTVMLLEFLPVPFAISETTRRWRRGVAGTAPTLRSPATLFVYLISRNVVYAAGDEFCYRLYASDLSGATKAEPIMLAIVAVTLSTIHQSSLVPLFLLMPDKLAPQWWSPVMPSVSCLPIAGGTSCDPRRNVDR